jgi:hypothetical protein
MNRQGFLSGDSLSGNAWFSKFKEAIQMENYPRDSYAYRELRRRKDDEDRRRKNKAIELMASFLLVVISESALILMLFS